MRLRILDGAGAFDPLAVILLLAKPSLGVMLTVTSITSDVTLSAWVGSTLGATRGFQLDAFIAQGLLLLFVLATARLAWPRRRFPGLFGGTMMIGFPPAARGTVG